MEIGLSYDVICAYFEDPDEQDYLNKARGLASAMGYICKVDVSCGVPSVLKLIDPSGGEQKFFAYLSGTINMLNVLEEEWSRFQITGFQEIPRQGCRYHQPCKHRKVSDSKAQKDLDINALRKELKRTRAHLSKIEKLLRRH